MYSTSGSKDNINVLFITGADVYIRKPGNFAELVQVIHYALTMAAENIVTTCKLKYIFKA